MNFYQNILTSRVAVLIFVRQICLDSSLAGGVCGISVSVRDQITAAVLISDEHRLEL